MAVLPLRVLVWLSAGSGEWVVGASLSSVLDLPPNGERREAVQGCDPFHGLRRWM